MRKGRGGEGGVGCAVEAMSDGDGAWKGDLADMSDISDHHALQPIKYIISFLVAKQDTIIV